ncbi:Transcription factor GTE11 [Dendrobium catenatum]|uniref:Transcription factor GTE11 n=1 Tax=Dendrobium catenatum TaxID=906689 RepID=A0A2I0X3H4_9ASPA|nr:Transcription factor GTE11 [Dendrobium catenatum]
MMAFNRGNFNMKKVPLLSFNLRSLSTANKISLKEKLMTELALVRSVIDKIAGDNPKTEQCCKRAPNKTIRSSSTKQQQVPANKKRKSSELTQANSNKNLSEVATNIDSKNSVGALRKKHCYDSNGFDESECKKLVSPTKSIRATMLKDRFADTILKAQLELPNIGSKERAFKMQQEKEKLTKVYNEEEIRIEAQSKGAVNQNAKSELRMKIKKEREASRLALEKMEATVEMNDYKKVMRELKGLGCQNMSFYVLREFGLFLKDDDFDDHKPAQISALKNDEIEEGEIII